MGCLSEPDKAEASQSEITMAQTAREQYDYYKSQIVPLEDYEIADAQQSGSDQERELSVNRSVNTAREAFQEPTAVTPNNVGNVVQLNNERAKAKSSAAAGGEMANKQRETAKKGGIVSLGRGISTTGSELMRRSASYGYGANAAQLSANNMVSNAQQGFIGEAAGLGLTMYGDKQGWFDKKK